MFAFANVVHFLADEFSGLRAGRLALFCVFVSLSGGFFVADIPWHSFLP